MKDSFAIKYFILSDNKTYLNIKYSKVSLSNKYIMLLFKTLDTPFVVLSVEEKSKRRLMIYTLYDYYGFDMLNSMYHKFTKSSINVCP